MRAVAACFGPVSGASRYDRSWPRLRARHTSGLMANKSRLTRRLLSRQILARHRAAKRCTAAFQKQGAKGEGTIMKTLKECLTALSLLAALGAAVFATPLPAQ